MFTCTRWPSSSSITLAFSMHGSSCESRRSETLGLPPPRGPAGHGLYLLGGFNWMYSLTNFSDDSPIFHPPNQGIHPSEYTLTYLGGFNWESDDSPNPFVDFCRFGGVHQRPIRGHGLFHGNIRKSNGSDLGVPPYFRKPSFHHIS